MVLSLMLLILGTLSAFSLPIAQYPQISPPTISVSTTYVGANAAVVNNTVASIIEKEVNGTEGMDYMSSNSDDAGQYKLTVVFNLGTDADMDSVKTQNNVSTAEASLPSDVKSYGVTTKKSSDDMVLIAALSSPKGTYSQEYLKNYADIYILDQLKRIYGVGDINVYGPDFSMRVWLNPDRMAELGITVAEVTSALSEQNLQAPAGTIGALPAPADQEKQYTGKVQGRIDSVNQFEDIIVRSDENGSFLRLKDIARIETGPRTNSVIAETDGATAMMFGIQMTSDANAMDVISKAKAVIDDAQKYFPPDMEYVEVVNNTRFITASLTEVAHTFFEALLLVIIVVYVFLQNWRATLIPMLAVPVSLVGTFAAFMVMGFSINTLTLFAMVLAIGLVVDDAIVVIENVERNMAEKHLPPMEATEVAMEEVQGPVVAIAFVLAAVFVPVAFLGGMMGVLYRQFALTIAVSMALSAFVALTLTPALCTLILKPHEEQEEHKKSFVQKIFDAFNRWYDRTLARYTTGVEFIVRHLGIAVVTLVIIVGLMGILNKLVPTSFVPSEDQGYFIASVSLPEGTSLNRTKETMDRLAAAIKEGNGISHVQSVTGVDITTEAMKPNSGLFFISLTDWDKRKNKAEQIDGQVRRIFGLGAELTPEASVIAFNPPSLPGLGMVGGFSLKLMDMTSHTDEELNEIAQKIVKTANARPELQGVYTTFAINTPSLNFDVDREKVKNLGVDLSDVFTALQVNYGGYEVNDFNRFGRSYKVVVQSDATYRSAAEGSKFVFVKSKSGTLVPLDTLISPKVTTSASVITRFNAVRNITIQGTEGEGYSSGQALDAIEEVVNEVAPGGFTIAWSGQSREEKSAGSKTGQVLAMSLIFVFLCLAALYESWSVPFSVLLTVPTGVFGAFVGEWAMSQSNSLYMQIGIITIIGLAAKNAILIVEFAKAFVDEGEDPVKAAVEAAKLRLRPILMTSFAFIIGCLPLAVASGAGAGSRNNMGIAVVAGMFFATMLGIFLIPAFFVIVEKVVEKLGGRKKKAAQKEPASAEA